MIKLLAPNHAGKGLALDQARVGIGDILLQVSVKFVCLPHALGENGVEIGEAGQVSSLPLTLRLAWLVESRRRWRQARRLSYESQPDLL